jgi:hypothetical protein
VSCEATSCHRSSELPFLSGNDKQKEVHRGPYAKHGLTRTLTHPCPVALSSFISVLEAGDPGVSKSSHGTHTCRTMVGWGRWTLIKQLHECKMAIIFPSVVLGFELRASHLLSQPSTASATFPALYALIILELGFCFLPRLTWTVTLLFYTSHCSWNDSHAPSHPGFSFEVGSWNFLPRLAWSHDPLIQQSLG